MHRSAPHTLTRLATLAAGLLLLAAPARATVMVFNSADSASRDTELASFLSTLGIAEAEHLVDFESFAVGTNLSDQAGLLPGGLVIRDTGPGTPEAIVRSSSSEFGDSTPLGGSGKALAHDEGASLEFDFSARPVDYVSLFDIDHTAGSGAEIEFVGGEIIGLLAIPEGTSGAPDDAEFFGLWRNDMPRITRVALDVGGDGEWGIDDVRYGRVPEPGAALLVACALLAAAVARH